MNLNFNPDDRCPRCDKPTAGREAIKGDPDQQPKAGDVVVCSSCLGVNIYNADLTMRLPTNEELREVSEHPELSELLNHALMRAPEKRRRFFAELRRVARSN